MFNPGDVAILPDPGYPAYFASAVFAGAEVVRVPLFREKGFFLDVDDISDGDSAAHSIDLSVLPE